MTINYTKLHFYPNREMGNTNGSDLLVFRGLWSGFRFNAHQSFCWTERRHDFFLGNNLLHFIPFLGEPVICWYLSSSVAPSVCYCTHCNAVNWNRTHALLQYKRLQGLKTECIQNICLVLSRIDFIFAGFNYFLYSSPIWPCGFGSKPASPW